MRCLGWAEWSPLLFLQENLPLASGCAACCRLTPVSGTGGPAHRLVPHHWQGRAQTLRRRCTKPQHLPPFKRVTLHIGWTLWLQHRGQIVTTCWAPMLNSASALWNVHKITKQNHRSPTPRKLHGGRVWSFSLRGRHCSDIQKGFLRFKSRQFRAWLSYRWWMNSFFLEA